MIDLLCRKIKTRPIYICVHSSSQNIRPLMCSDIMLKIVDEMEKLGVFFLNKTSLEQSLYSL